jgi:hypothetical protein
VAHGVTSLGITARSHRRRSSLDGDLGMVGIFDCNIIIDKTISEITSLSLKRHQGASGVYTFHEKRASALRSQ